MHKMMFFTGSNPVSSTISNRTNHDLCNWYFLPWHSTGISRTCLLHVQRTQQCSGQDFPISSLLLVLLRLHHVGNQFPRRLELGRHDRSRNWWLYWRSHREQKEQEELKLWGVGEIGKHRKFKISPYLGFGFESRTPHHPICHEAISQFKPKDSANLIRMGVKVAQEFLALLDGGQYLDAEPHTVCIAIEPLGIQMYPLFYFLAHPQGDRSAICVIDLQENMRYEKDNWDVVPLTQEYAVRDDAIKAARRIAAHYNLEYQLFESRYDYEINEVAE